METAAGDLRHLPAPPTAQEKELRTLDIYRAYPANQLSAGSAALGVYAGRLWEFVSDDPRESNTEGGIFPAIFGTVMMVIIMSLIVVPLGVLAALYLREYAKQGPLVRIVRIAVNNLAGVPSIVFGVFGLGFFVYFVGGGIDRLFFPEALPTPDLRHGRHPLGVAHPGPAHRARGDRGLRGGAGRGAALDARGLAGHGRHQVPDHPARGAARGRARAS